MKTLLLVAGGRGGSDFFRGLFDGHSQVLTFPGYLRINKDFQEMLNLNFPDQISKRFISLYTNFFNSKASEHLINNNIIYDESSIVIGESLSTRYNNICTAACVE